MFEKRSASVVNLEHVSKSYIVRNWKTLLHRKKQNVIALTDVSLSVRRGEIMGLLGPNGAGKTTLLKILATLVTPDSGTVSILNLDVVKQAYQIRQKIGFVNTNSRAFYWRMSGRENLVFFGKLYNLHGKRLHQQVDELLDIMGMQEKSEDRFGTYSSGERQRFAIARAMLADPEILLMDEATSNLDPIASQELIEFVKTELSQKHKKTIIWCTHNLFEADMLCDRLAILHKGRIIRCGAVAEIKRSMAGAERYRLTVSEIPALLYEHQGFENGDLSQEGKVCSVIVDSSGVPGLLNNLTAIGVDVYECRRIERPLEEAFTNMMKDQDAMRGEAEAEWGSV